MDAPPSGPPPLSPAHFMGGLLIEVILACMLYGLTTLQVFMYYQKYTNDTRVLRSLVALVWFLETLHVIFCLKFIYFYTVTGFGNFNALVQVDWGVGTTVLLSILIAFCVYCWYIWKIWIMSKKSRFWTCVLSVLVVARVVFGLGSATLCYSVDNWIKLQESKLALTTVSGSLSSAALIDILVAILLTYYLKFRTMRNQFTGKSDSMINRILLYTVNTGAIIALASFAAVFLFAFDKNSLAFLGLVEIQAKLYANSFLGSLNARAHIRNAGSKSGTQYSSSSTDRHQTSVPMQVDISRVTITRTDRAEQDSDCYDMQDVGGSKPAILTPTGEHAV